MDKDKGGAVEIEEFKAWWKDAYKTSQMGNVVGAIEAVNKRDDEGGRTVRHIGTNFTFYLLSTFLQALGLRRLRSHMYFC